MQQMEGNKEEESVETQYTYMYRLVNNFII